MSMAGLVAAALLALSFGAEAGEARLLATVPQQTGFPPGVGQQVQRQPSRDTSSVRDSLLARRQVVWGAADSVMTALLAREGRSVVRFQGDSSSVDAVSGYIKLFGRPGQPAVVQRDSAMVMGDSIIWNDSLEIVHVYGSDIWLQDPGMNPAPIRARGVLSYDMSQGRARLQAVSTGVIENGELMLLSARRAVFVGDVDGTTPPTIYGHYGSITSCDDPNPHYHIEARWLKIVAGRFLVARPAVFYIADVPVFILPFMVNDLRTGRRSGILTPRFGFSDIIRNSSTYRRQIENVGVYWATSDYMDARAWMDWRSGTSPSQGDPGFIRYSGELQYKWLDRFLSGRFAVGHSRQGNGLTNTQLSLSHLQEFSMTRRLSAELNYVTSTRLQQQQEFIASRELATIRSRLNYSHKLGPFSISAGGSRTQYPGQDLVDQTLPTLSISSQPLAIGELLSITPSLSVNNTQRFNVERTGALSYRYVSRPDGSVDSLRVTGSSRNSTMSLDLPVSVGSVRLSNSFQLTDVEDDFPQIFMVRDVRDTSNSELRVYPRTFRTDLDWRTNLSMPATFLPSTFNITPSFSVANVHPGAYWVRSERSGGEFVSQKKRPLFGVSMSPTVYGLFGGFGPFSRIRHAIGIQLGYSFAPAAEVSDAYLQAIGATRQGYLGSLRQSAISLGMNHVIEASLGEDSLTGATGRKIRLLALNLTPLSWDFELAKARNGTGISTDRFGINAKSDLLPGLDFSADYSLFEGSVVSDSARFKPFLTGLRTSFAITPSSNPFTAFLGIFRRGSGTSGVAAGSTGVDAPPLPPLGTEVPPPLTDFSPMGSGGAVGSGGMNDPLYARAAPTEFSLRVDFSLSRQRPPTGDVIIIENDARERCQLLNVNPLAFDQCVREYEAIAFADPNFGLRPPGGAFVRQPTRSTVSGSLSTPLTQNWSATWATSYDFALKDFANHNVNLRRDFHDWDANFTFTQSPSGNFMFAFFIALKAQRELKFDYRDVSYSNRGR